MKLPAFLLTPVQRIPRYTLLLKVLFFFFSKKKKKLCIHIFNLNFNHNIGNS